MMRFVDEFMVDGNARLAAIRAGYSSHAANNAGQKLKNDPRLKIIIAEREVERYKSLGVTKERILEELASIAFHNLKDYIEIDETGNSYFNFDKMTPAQAAALTEFTTETTKGRYPVQKMKVRSSDKLAALEKLGKYLGMFNEKVEVSGNLSLGELVHEAVRLKEAQAAAPKATNPEESSSE